MSTDYKVTGISFQPDELAGLDDLADKYGCSRSAMIRRIMREWQASEKLRFVAQAHTLGMITTEDALQRVIDVTADMPLAIHVIGDNDDSSA